MVWLCHMLLKIYYQRYHCQTDTKNLIQVQNFLYQKININNAYTITKLHCTTRCTHNSWARYDSARSSVEQRHVSLVHTLLNNLQPSSGVLHGTLIPSGILFELSFKNKDKLSYTQQNLKQHDLTFIRNCTTNSQRHFSDNI